MAYLLFDESSSAEEDLTKAALANSTDFDLIQYMNLEEIFDAEEHFDANRLLQTREKFPSASMQALLHKAIGRCKALSKKYNISEYIKQANLCLLELAKDADTTVAQFSEAADRLKLETGYDVWARMAQVRGAEDTVKLQPSKGQGKGAAHNRDSYNLILVGQGGDSAINDDSMDFNSPIEGFGGLS